jgi:glutaredoxin 3
MARDIDPLDVPPGSRLDLFVSPSCPYCRAAREYYEKRGTPYTAHDAENDSAARERMFAYSGGDPTVPAIVVDGTYVQSGWGDPPRG